MTPVRVLRRWLAPTAFATVALSVAACGRPSGTKPTVTASETPVAIGAELYPSAAAVRPVTATAGPEPIVAPQGLVQFDEVITLAAEVDGKLELVATP
nr:hypothetical protein [Fimbriiglobus sp.]